MLGRAAQALAQKLKSTTKWGVALHLIVIV